MFPAAAHLVQAKHPPPACLTTFKMKPAATLLALALALCLGTALANDLQITVKVYDCKGK